MRRYLFPVFLIAIAILAACLWFVPRKPVIEVVPAGLAEPAGEDSGGARSAIIATPQANAPIPFFPWPPPPASVRTPMPEGMFADRARFPTMKQVAGVIEAALRAAGFGSWGYFSLPDQPEGFGLVTPVEQIDESGKPLAGRWRWQIRPYAAATMSNLESLARIQRPAGRYRAFVFIVSVTPTGDHPTECARLSLAQKWNSSGFPHLTPDLASIQMTERHRLTVRVYEFEQPDKLAPVCSKPSPWTVDEHLRSAGIVLPGMQ